MIRTKGPLISVVLQRFKDESELMNEEFAIPIFEDCAGEDQGLNIFDYLFNSEQNKVENKHLQEIKR